tara:strand:- start:3732 stop:3959 length:228 start_codon:yes stop_codon:yes gene_type:complete
MSKRIVSNMTMKNPRIRRLFIIKIRLAKLNKTDRNELTVCRESVFERPKQQPRNYPTAKTYCCAGVAKKKGKRKS